MQLELDEGEAAELRRLIDHELGELTSEIADTDNARFGRELRVRRDLLKGIQGRLSVERS